MHIGTQHNVFNSIDIIKNRRRIDRYCLLTLTSCGPQWTVSAIYESNLTEYRTDSHVVVFLLRSCSYDTEQMVRLVLIFLVGLTVIEYSWYIWSDHADVQDQNWEHNPEKGEKTDISSLSSNLIEKPDGVSSKAKQGQVFLYLARDRQPTTGTSRHPMICDEGYDRYFANHTL